MEKPIVLVVITSSLSNSIISTSGLMYSSLNFKHLHYRQLMPDYKDTMPLQEPLNYQLHFHCLLQHKHNLTDCMKLYILRLLSD